MYIILYKYPYKGIYVKYFNIPGQSDARPRVVAGLKTRIGMAYQEGTERRRNPVKRHTCESATLYAAKMRRIPTHITHSGTCRNSPARPAPASTTATRVMITSAWRSEKPARMKI